MNDRDLTSTLLQDDKSHVFRSWTAQRNLSPLEVAGGEGAWFWDRAERRYLDFCSQRVNLNLGHQHPRLVAAIRKQAGELITVSQECATAPRSMAARLISERAPDGLNKVFFTNCGTDAVEHAVRMARIHTGRHKILAMYRSYHGSTAGSISLTGDPRRWNSEPGMPGIVRFIGPYLYRSSFGAETGEEECDRALAHLEEILMYEGAQNVAAILLEPVVGSNGALVPPPGYLEGIRRICDKHGIAMICDEVMTAFGRCGEWFSVNNWSVIPDLITFAKGVNSGYVPLGGVLISDAIADTFWERPFPGGGTYFGHALACSTAVASIEAFEDEKILDRARHLGKHVLEPELRLLHENHACVGEFRGIGCLWALELVKCKKSKEMLVPFNASGRDLEPMKMIEQECLRRGLYVLTTFNRLYVCPPLIISEKDVTNGLHIISEALRKVDKTLS